MREYRRGYELGLRGTKEMMKVGKELQRLFFQRKQMDSAYSLFDYNVQVNDMIQLMVRQPLGQTQVDNIPKKTPDRKRMKRK